MSGTKSQGQSKGQKSSADQNNNSAFAKEVLNQLECPICTEIMIPPVHQCESGHSICSICRSKVKKCPNCRGSFINARNLALEGILSQVNAKCRFSPCEMNFPMDLLVEHFKVCDYRPIKCYQTRTIVCEGKDIDYSKYLMHLKNEHKFELFQKEGTSFLHQIRFKVFPGKSRYRLYGIGGQTFVINHAVVDDFNNTEKKWLTWISLIAKDEDAAKYAFRIRIKPPIPRNGNGSYLEWKICAHSIHKSYEDVKKSTERMLLSADIIEPYFETLVQDPQFRYRLSMNITLDSQP